MATAAVSPSYGIEIPREIRESMGIQPGDKFEVRCHQHHFELVPIVDTRELRGSVKGIDTAVERDEEDLV